MFYATKNGDSQVCQTTQLLAVRSCFGENGQRYEWVCLIGGKRVHTDERCCFQGWS